MYFITRRWKSRKGFMLLPALGMIALWGTIVLGWIMIWDWATPAAVDRWY